VAVRLAHQATEVDTDVIVACVVDFTAESAAMVNPTKTVLLGEARAHCPMAEMIDAD
jgi:quinolinate synthase